MMDAARLAEELRSEQETAQMVEKERRDQEEEMKRRRERLHKIISSLPSFAFSSLVLILCLFI